MKEVESRPKYRRARKAGWLTVVASLVPIIVEIISKVLSKSSK